MPDLPTDSLTFLFSDIEGSTRLVTELGDAYQALHADHGRLLRAAWTTFGGQEVGTEGDSFFVVFASAPLALRAAAAAHRALASHAWPPGAEVRVRIGVHTGQAILVGGDYLGLDVNRAARVCAAGHGGQTLVSEAAHDAAAGALPPDLALRDLGRHRLKDVGVMRLWQLDVPGLPATFARLRALDEHPSNVPAGLPELLGRATEVAEATALVRVQPVVTLTGPGGIGKSRIAIRVAADAVTAFADGVSYVDAASLDAADRVADRLLEVMELDPDPGLAPRDALVRLLGGRSVLLLLDNADRVAGLARLVGDIVRACAGVRVLATSRSPLRIGAERELLIGPLEPAPAMSLFLARAREILPAFDLSDADAAIVADICARLDGLPLAIELAAARTRVLPVAALRDRLARRLPLLAGGARDAPDRQQTMRATIAWSYDLLDERERALLDRLAVFEGPFELAAAEAMGTADDDTLAVLQSLVERSLVARVHDDADGAEPRFRLLGTIREFALEMLEAGGAAEDARDRHLRHWLDFVRTEHDRSDLDDIAIEARIERHEADYAAALERALPVPGEPAIAPRARLGLALAAALGRHWWLHGHVRDGAAWLERALAATSGSEGPELAAAMYWAGVLHEGAGDDERARRRLEQALERYEAAGDRLQQARVLNSLAIVARSSDALDTAESLLARSLAIRREVSDQRGLATTLNNLGIVEIDRGRFDAALEILSEAVALDRAAGSRTGAAYSLLAYGSALHGVGRAEEAAAAIGSSLETFAELRDAEGVADAIDELAEIAAGTGAPETAMRLFLTAGALRDHAGVRVRAVDRRRREPVVEATRRLVAPATLARLTAESSVADLDAAVALARSVALVSM
ncbi:MAG: tetratricopeptide repeat protein [Chloroflexota bacterium]